MVLAMILGLVAMASAAFAAPGENSPWKPSDSSGNIKSEPDPCNHPSPGGDFDGGWYTNTKSGKTHCFKA